MKLTILNLCALLSVTRTILSMSSPSYSFYYDNSDFRLSYKLPTYVWDRYNIMPDNTTLSRSMIGNYGDLTHVNLANISPTVNNKSNRDVSKSDLSTAQFNNISIVIAALGLDSTHLSDRLNDFYTSTGDDTTYKSYRKVKQQVDCDNEWWCDTYDSLISAYTGKGSLKAWLRELTWSIATVLIKLGSNVATICWSIASAVKSGSTKKSCNGFSYWLNLNTPGEAELTYLVGIAPYMSGSDCDTQATQQSVQDLTSKWLVETSQRNMVSYCTRFHNEGIWWADVRLLLWQENAYSANQYIWDIPCEDR